MTKRGRYRSEETRGRADEGRREERRGSNERRNSRNSPFPLFLSANKRSSFEVTGTAECGDPEMQNESVDGKGDKIDERRAR